jgi:ATP-dependent exoDNAse (exonuclease V) alpha subunit
MCYNGTDKIRGIFKTQEWIITDVDKTEEKIGLCREGKYVVLPWNEFCELFEYSFAITAHKCQGITIKEDFVVHETNIMIWEVAYTAISRGTALSKVHIAGSISEMCLKRASRSDSIALKMI